MKMGWWKWQIKGTPKLSLSIVIIIDNDDWLIIQILEYVKPNIKKEFKSMNSFFKFIFEFISKMNLEFDF